MKKYIPSELEWKWQKKWQEEKIYSPDLDKAKKPFYNLMMFPYPSAEGMHVGNMYAFTGADVFGRFMRMKGYDVFEPIGLDGFGIHSENYAIKVGKHPAEQAKISEKNFYRQLHSIGNSYDWTRTVETYKPDYYKWTQWIFVQLFKKGLAYRAKAQVNWCPLDKTVLADEQVIDGKCERDGATIEKRELEQWFFKITSYADRLLNNIDKLDWSERVKIAQRNWIGRSEGALISFELKTQNSKLKTKIEVFTTRPDTLFGATFMVISPELAKTWEDAGWKVSEEVEIYVKEALETSENDRNKKDREKTGVFAGIYAINPANQEKIPVWIANYILAGYGTGAIMAVPAHDQRDFEFAKKFDLPIKPVIQGKLASQGEALQEAYVGEGEIINSGDWNGWKTPESISEVVKWLEEKGIGKKETKYHLRDWLISRQRYWGPPIPMIYCEMCDWQPVPERDLPVLLPKVSDWKPKGTGKSPLSSVESFVNTKCPNCGSPAKRETDVSDTFLDSAWYFFRYTSTDDEKSAWTHGRVKKWLPVDMYIGGAEHSVLHLLYSRFITMVFSDLGLIDFDEPYRRFFAHGLIIKDGAKMSKSRGNVVVPDAYINRYGADSLRMYLMFIGPFSAGGDFSDSNMEGVHRFLNKVWRLIADDCINGKRMRGESNKKYDYILHRTIKRVTGDIEKLSYNTAIAALMEYYNELTKNPALDLGKREVEVFLKLLAPFAPHMTEELWQQVHSSEFIDHSRKKGEKSMNYELQAKRTKDWSVHSQPWPKYDLKLIFSKTITLVVQVNGKVRDTLLVEAGISKEEAQKLALKSGKVRKFLDSKRPQKVIFVPGRLINFVI